MTYDLTSFHRGFGQGEDRAFGKDAKYGYSDGVLANFEGEITLGYSQEEVDLLIRNGRFEDTEINQWCADGAKLIINALPPIAVLRNPSTTANPA